MSERLASLAALVPSRLVGEGGIVIDRALADSRRAGPGSLFVALADEPEKALAHAQDALARGAAAIASRADLGLGVPAIVCDAPGLLLARAAEALEGHPTRALRCIGITGTNGKTTTTRILVQALRALGKSPAWIGTGVMEGPAGTEASVFTTPFGDAISAFARKSLEAGATHLVMEVSSHALAQHRADGVAFDVAGFTNLTRDHLDYHPTMDAYGEAKARLFVELGVPEAVIHVGDAFGASLARRARGHVVRVAVGADAELRADEASYGLQGIEASIRRGGERAHLRSPLVGRHNLENLLVALGCLLAEGIPLADAVAALGSATGAEGRLERVAHPTIGVFVDYAHTPDAIARVLAALRPLGSGRSIVLFGCGGDRDRGKRPEMARAAVEGADLVVVTSDNPRTEEPSRIVDDVLAGIDPARSPRLAAPELASASRGHLVEIDRREAIRLAIRAARPGDLLLLAGKGHEDYQIVGTTKHPFDDRVEARRALEAREDAA